MPGSTLKRRRLGVAKIGGGSPDTRRKVPDIHCALHPSIGPWSNLSCWASWRASLIFAPAVLAPQHEGLAKNSMVELILDGSAHLRRDRPTLRVDIMSGNDEDVEVARATLRDGAFDYLGKPFSITVLARVVAAAVSLPN